MKKTLALAALLCCCLAAFAAPPDGWTVDYEAALQKAKAEKRHVLVLFTGSDWCGWCIKLRNEVLSKPEFRKFAADKLILVYCDFPNQDRPSRAQLAKQRKWAEQLGGVKGYPTTVIVDGDGKVTGRIGGFAPLKTYLKKLDSAIK